MLEQEEEENRRGGYRTERGETNDAHMLPALYTYDAYLHSTHVRICVRVYLSMDARVYVYLSTCTYNERIYECARCT